MKKMKRWLAVFLMVTMVLTAFPADLWNWHEVSGETLVEGYFKYVPLNNGTVRIDGYTGINAEVYIPATIDNKTVTQINASAFSSNSVIELVDMSDTQIVEIGQQAFAYCSNLQKVVLPDTLEMIPKKMFYRDTSLEEVVIPEGITEIAVGAFSDCTSLKSIVIPDSVTALKSSTSSDQTFYKCTSLESVVVGNGVEGIEKNTFMDCTNLKKVTLGKSIAKIGDNAFKNCGVLESICIPNACTAIGSESFSGCVSLAEIDLGAGLQSIDSAAFSGCSSLTSIVFPDSLTQMKSSTSRSTFGKCTSLEKIVFGKGLTTIPEYAFRDCASLEEIYVGGSLESLKGGAFNGCTKLSAMYCLDEKCPAVDSTTTFTDCAAGFTIYCLENGDRLGTYGVYPSKVYDKTDLVCEVSFDPNTPDYMEEESEIITKEVVIGYPVSPIISPKTTGHDFSGWYYDEDCTGEKVYFPTEVITEDITYYADWSINSYTLTFDPMYDATVDETSREVLYREPVGELPEPVRENYLFLGWFQGQNGAGEKYTADTPMPGKDTIIHAHWEQIVSVAFPSDTYAMQTTDKARLERTVTPANAYDSTLIWESSDENVVTVDHDGNIRALNKGIAVVSATTVSGKSASCTITVTIKPSISLNYSEIEAYVGEKFQLTANVIGESTEVTYKSSDTSIATVDKNGQITTKAIGSCVISATANGVTANCTVNVMHVSLDLNKSSMTIYTKGTTKGTLFADVSGRNHTVVWKSSNPAVATVSGGLVVAKKAGTTTISATANGITKNCKVTVKKPVLTVKKTSLKVKKKKKVSISYKITPSAKVTFTNKTPKIIKVSKKGVVTGKKKGKGKVVVSALGLKKTVKITVKK